jgi:hypothetical protein
VSRRMLLDWVSTKTLRSGCSVARERVILPFSRRLRIEPLENRRLLAITVDTLVDEADGSIIDGDISLRDAIAAAALGETIDFSVTGTIQLSNLGQLVVDKSLTIDGPGAAELTIRAFDPTPTMKNGDGGRVFFVSDGNDATFIDIEIAGLTLTGGDRNSSGLSGGGAILSSENLTVADSTISGNGAAGAGGGIANQLGNYGDGGNLVVINCTDYR